MVIDTKGVQMRVKIFLNSGKLFGKSASVDEFGEEINTWLKTHSDIKIVKIKQSSCGGSLEPGQHLISIWYGLDE